MIIFLVFLLGLLLGSFLNVCIHRWPREESVVRPGSHCPNCQAPIGWYDNIPLVSYLLLRGKCRACGAPVSIRYPLVELLTGLLYAAVVVRYGLDPFAFKVALFGSMMLVLFFTDLAEFILPDEITIGGTLLGFVLSVLVYLDSGFGTVVFVLAGADAPRGLLSLADSVSSAAILGGFLWLVGEAYFRLRKIEGLGLGDVKMVAMIAAFWGLSQTVFILVLASLVGAVSGVLIVVIGRKQWHYALPFGSYLAATSILVTLWGDAILSWYWSKVLPAV